MKKTRLAFLNTHPIQYFAPLYAYLNRSNDLAVSALYLSDYSIRGALDHNFGRFVKWDVDLTAGYGAIFVAGANKRPEPKSFFAMIAPQLWPEIVRRKFDALVVHGHSPAAMLLGVVAAKAAGTRVFMRCETHLGLPCSARKAALRRPIMGALYNSLDGVLAIGTANTAFYRAMGVPQRRIFSVPYTVDNDRFTAASRIAPERRKELRASLGAADDRPIILYAAKFQRRKRPQDLLEAAARLNAQGASFHLALIGSGEMEDELRVLAAELALDNVHFHGFVNQSLLPEIYAACDLFILPSQEEPWGLAINEAMCAGLPIVATRGIGCVPDLVRDGLNGQTYPAGDVPALTGALAPLLQDAGLRQRMGDASRTIIARWSYAECGDGLRAALAVSVR